ncbi:MAG TPA: hypothetical protein DCR64_15180, partial [Vibrio sp.]|nr:hypothetical protein [Vibrio sp.]
LGAIFAYAVRLEIRKDNPVHGVKHPPDKRCDQYLDRSDIVKLRDLLREAEDAGKNPVPINVIRVLLLTGCRKSEILELKWQDIDFDNATLRLHASKNGFRDVQLGSEVLNLFQRISETKINDYVFPSSRNNGHYVGLQKFWERNFQNKGLSKYRIHDLRHTFASIAVKRYNILMVKTMLGHRDIKSTLVYSHVGDKEKREAIEDISNEIYALL